MAQLANRQAPLIWDSQPITACILFVLLAALTVIAIAADLASKERRKRLS